MLSLSAGAWNLPVARTPSARVVTTAPGPSMNGAGRVASPILPGRLYLSDFLTAAHEPTLRRLGITHVVSVCETVPTMPPALAGQVQTLHVRLADRSNEDILSQLGRTTEFINRAVEEEEGVVLVHCMMGISRSATVVAAYLISTRTAPTATAAVEYVQARRGIVCPNLGFRQQLDTYAEQLAKSASEASGAPARAKVKTMRRKIASGKKEVDVQITEVKVETKMGRWAEMGIRERMRKLKFVAGTLKRGDASASAKG